MLGLDDKIVSLSHGGLWLALAVALLLGVRHATDPDHLTAVSTLVLGGDERGRARRAGLLGLSWGIGHATTLLLFGLPFVLFRDQLPSAVAQAAEVAIGIVIIALAARLLLRWRRGYFHIHPHTHDGVRHAHPHMHEARPHPPERAHRHAHAEALGRSPLAAFGIGLVHGTGGSAGVGVLLIGTVAANAQAAIALVVFAAATALSMALISAAFAQALVRADLLRRVTAAIPALGIASLVFGAWYALGALNTVPYVF
jgi:ABC-type nickel/cobalt efflux system permease component RcnA